MRALIVGAGVAGPALAYWLRRSGHEVTLVERAPRLRTGGYLIDFWGSGYEVADRMGIVPRLLHDGYVLTAAREVSDGGRTIATLDPARLADSAGGRYVSLVRSDLARAIHDALDDGVELILDDTVTSLTDLGDRVEVTFERSDPRAFDLVFGADGLHSRVRELAFGPEEQFARELGIAVAAFDVTGYRPREELVAVMHGAVGSQSIRVALRDDVTLFLLTFRHAGPLPDRLEDQRDVVRAAMAGAGGETERILAQLERADSLYLDLASQIRMPSWSRGRIALLGDAAACPSLLAGQGTALAMVGAYLIAAELAAAGGDHVAAFRAYERRLKPMVSSKQDAARGLGTAFAPATRGRLLLRNTLMRLMNLRVVADLVMGRSLRDPIELPPFPDHAPGR
ncbi:FAD-binding domain [Microbacterium bovistercoris]|uniref:FAD-binding domain n=1 Tax=Microbacterium bovistercoris TaxID=2293570 RepID=A0A371NXY5_9MICO|nr:FAD-binding domain [Microbacterium bovistercoris]REJ08254.1 FAD-binding domain [Microbacterium bovistercoris]